MGEPGPDLELLLLPVGAMEGGGANCAAWAAEKVGLAIAMPDAAIALAKPVGLRFAVPRRQGRFLSASLSLSLPLSLPLVELIEMASESFGALSRRLLPFVGVLDCDTDGYSGARSAVGDSTIGVIVPYMDTSCPSWLSCELRGGAGAVAACRGAVEMGATWLSDLFDVFLRTSFDGCRPLLLEFGDAAGSFDLTVPSRFFPEDDEGVVGRDGVFDCFAEGFAGVAGRGPVGVGRSSMYSVNEVVDLDAGADVVRLRGEPLRLAPEVSSFC